jgi:hypothetical protein
MGRQTFRFADSSLAVSSSCRCRKPSPGMQNVCNVQQRASRCECWFNCGIWASGYKKCVKSGVSSSGMNAPRFGWISLLCLKQRRKNRVCCRWVEFVAYRGTWDICVIAFLSEACKRKKVREGPYRRWAGNVEMDLRKQDCENGGVDWIFSG